MKKILSILSFLILFIVIISFTESKPFTGKQILQKMHKRFAGKWYKTSTFSQKTESYKNDSLLRTAVWREAIIYPDYFRISFGDIKEWNTVIFIKDSSYNFAKGKLVRKGLKGEDMTFLLGGMYFQSFDSILVKIQREGYDISKAHESNWNGNKYYVLGTSTDVGKQNQLRIDK